MKIAVLFALIMGVTYALIYLSSRKERIVIAKHVWRVALAAAIAAVIVGSLVFATTHL